jgi:hypothetical protein
MQRSSSQTSHSSIASSRTHNVGDMLLLPVVDKYIAYDNNVLYLGAEDHIKIL